MMKTLSNFKVMVQGFKKEVGFKEISELSDYYKETNDQRCIAYVFIDQFGHLYNQTKKFNLLDEDDRVSISLVKIEEALQEYDPTKGAKLQTLVSTYVYRECFGENQKRGYDKRAINHNNEVCTSYELFTEQDIDWGEADYYECEYIDLINSLELTENEKMYCLVVGLNNHRLTDTEVANKLGVTPAAINYLKKRLRVKLQPAFS